MAYTTAADVRTYLAITGSGDDALLTVLIAAAQQDIDEYCHRTFEASADSTRYFDFSTVYIDRATLWLDGDLATITTVTNGDSVEVTGSEYTTLPRNETPYNRLRILSNSGKYWTYTDEWMDAISVLGKWAYSTTAPDSIVHACKRLAAFKYKQRDTSLFEVTAIEAGVVVAPVGIPADIKAVLAPFRKL